MTTANTEMALRSPRVDLFENERELLVVADVPGVPRDALSIELVGDVLVLAGDVPALGEGTDALAPYRFERKIRLVANVTGEEARAVRFSLSNGRLELFGRSAGRGEAHAYMPVEYKGQDAEIAFNPDYVIDGLKNSENGLVKLEFNEKTSPGKFNLGENYIYIVMPITIDA